MISSKLSPRRHNPRPPSICISKPPILIVPPPPPLEWPPKYIIAEFHWTIPGYPTLETTIELTKTEEYPPYQAYGFSNGTWSASCRINTDTAHFDDQSAVHHPQPYASTQYLAFDITPYQPFDAQVLAYPYYYPYDLTVNDHWKYP